MGAIDYESPSNLLKFSSKTNPRTNYTEATTMNSCRKMENLENEANIDATSMFLRTPNEKEMNITSVLALDQLYGNSGAKCSVNPFFQKK